MSWQTHMVPIVRGLIFDLTPPYSYCDTRLEELICTCAVLVVQEVDFSALSHRVSTAMQRRWR
jgi:hypothetical protein